MRNNRLTGLLLGTGLLFAAVIGPATAQTGGGSTYSIFNIGDLQTSSNAAAAGRGGVECAIPSPTLINSMNPAGWQDLRYVTLQAAMNFEQYRVSDQQNTIYQNTRKLQDFAACFPFSEKMGGAAAFAIHPYSTVNYRTQVAQRVPNGDSGTTMRTTYSGRGGVSEAYVGMSLRPIPFVTVGGSVNLFFGAITGANEVSFDDTRMNTASYQTAQRYVGLGGRIGLQAQPTADLRLGALYETGAKLDRESISSTHLFDNGRELLDTLSQRDDQLTVPPRITVGASLVSGRFLFGADASFQSWDKSHFSTARPENRFALGVDRLPSSSLNASGFERWTFRFGGYYKQTYYEPLAGTGIDQMAVTLGARVPIGGTGAFNSNTAFDIALEFGTRGKTESGLTKEAFGKLSVELSVSEIWFIRSRR